MSRFAALLDEPALQPIFAALPQARLVGGCVRDTLAGCRVADIDIAVPDLPEDGRRALQAAGLRVIDTGLAHGTLTAISQGRGFEITTLRRDLATDGRHASVAWTDSFAEDAARRDFTINAMSVDRAGVLHDYFGGAADLASGTVRFVGDAAVRVAEDYLRILRFFRFHARYASGPPDAAAEAAIEAGLGGLAILSAERVWAEIKRILAAPDPRAAVALMWRLGVLAAVLPEAVDLPRLERLVGESAPPDPLLRLAALLDGPQPGLAERLRLSGAEQATLAGLLGGPAPVSDASDAALRRALADTPAGILAGRCWLAAGGAAYATLRQRLAALPAPVFPLEGRHALLLGALPGPQIGQALREVRAWWLERGCQDGIEACMAELARHLGR